MLTVLRKLTSNKFEELFHNSFKRHISCNENVIKEISSSNTCKYRTNEMGVQMISQGIYDQLFSNNTKVQHNQENIKKFKQELLRHDMDSSKAISTETVDFKLPKLEGKDIIEHFFNIAEEQCGPYRELLKEIISTGIPQTPKVWEFKPGWTRYSRGNVESVPYPEDNALIFDIEVCMNHGPLPTIACAVSKDYWYSWCSNALISNDTSPVNNQHITLDNLIPLQSTNDSISECERNRKRVIVGHNVSYDRARVREQYWMQNTELRFVDTMSLHVCVSGVTSYQRALLSSKSLKEPSMEDEHWMSQSSLNSLLEVHKLYCGSELNKEARNIFVEGNLQDVRNDFQNLMLYCANDVMATFRVLCKLYPMFMERFPHPATLAGMLEIGSAYLPVNDNWLRYISESDLTYEDFDIESKILLSKRANKACRLMIDEKYKEDLWMWDQDWSTRELKMKQAPRVTKSKKIKDLKNNNELNAEKLVNKDKANENEEEIDQLEIQFANLFETKSLLPARRPLLPGYPAWYKKLCDKPNDSPEWTPDPQNISTSMQIAPKLLRLSWEGYPLHYMRNYGWGFLVPYRTTRDDVEFTGILPFEQLLARCPVLIPESLEANENQSGIVMGSLWKDVQDNISRKDYYRKIRKDKSNGVYKGTGVWCNVDIENCAWFIGLPHKDGGSKKVGNPLARDFLNKFAENVLAGDDKSAEKVISIARMLSYWRNNRDRVKQQMVVWLNNVSSHKPIESSEMRIGAIIPQIVVCGTLTRRAMEATWLTASNAKSDRIGSELRAMIQAPPGYSIVGADVDSQELWIAAVIGDAHAAGMHGATPFGWMTLSGSKSQGTDMHSVTANAVGISRDHAKVINYARIYGAGQNFAERLLKQFNPTMTDAEARSKATKMFVLTKGKKVFRLKKEYIDNELNNISGGLYFNKRNGYSSYQALNIAKAYGKSVSEMFHKPQWEGGTESAMFNRLEEIAGSAKPVTPFLHCRLSRALEPASPEDTDRFLPTRVNWVVQSGAVDFLHLMLVSMRHLMKSSARFCLSFHDEVRYLVAEEHKYDAALAMHITNLLTRAFCVQRLGLSDLPQSIAFFTSVEVDTVLRKEATAQCITPSNPRGLSATYGIPIGEALDIKAALLKVKKHKT